MGVEGIQTADSEIRAQVCHRRGQSIYFLHGQGLMAKNRLEANYTVDEGKTSSKY